MPYYLFVCICWKAIMQLPIHSVCLLGLSHYSRTESQKQELEHFLQNINKMLRVITKKKPQKNPKHTKKPTPFRKHDWNAFNLGFPSGTICNCLLKQSTEERNIAFPGGLTNDFQGQAYAQKKQQLLTLHPVTASLFMLPVTLPLFGPLEGLWRLPCRMGLLLSKTWDWNCCLSVHSSENPSIDFLGVTPPQLFSQPNAASPEYVIVIDQNSMSGLINVLSLLVRALVLKECPSCYLWHLIKVPSYLNNQCVVK